MGTYSHKNIKLNLNDRIKFDTNTDINKNWMNTNHLGNVYPYPDGIDKVSRVLVRPILNELYDTKDVNNDFLENAVYRYLSLQHYSLSIHISGNLDIRSGDVCSVVIPSPNPTDITRERETDSRLSGQYLIHSIKTTINRTSSMTIVYLCKDSHF